ncbi:hypothetical protein D3C78_749760 [compost metagenome]
MKNTPYTSIVAMRVWVKCMKSAASKVAASPPYKLLPSSLLPNRYISGIIAMPSNVPAILQPNGFSPNNWMPSAMMIFPSGGCVFS